MTNLTQTAYYTRRLLKIGAMLIVFLITARIVVGTGIKIWRRLRPPPPTPPTVSFGKLPKINFPENPPLLADSPLNFKLETIEGGLPKLTTVTKVYFRPKQQANFLSADRAVQQAIKMGFKNKPEKISDNNYRWINQAYGNLTLEMDINSGNFHLFSDYLNDETLLLDKNLPPSQQAIQEAKNFLASLNLLPADLSNGRNEFIYLKKEGSGLISAASFSDANFLRVNFFRTDLDGLKILPPNPKKTPVSFLFSSAKNQAKRVVEINYDFYPIEQEIFATYPLKEIDQAWEELQNGQGFITQLEQNKNQIIVRKVYLAFYDSLEHQPYWQPIYVFEGDGNFLAYVAAIDPKWTE